MPTSDASLDETPGIDRRAALRKVAAAGTVAWTAPLILSGTAHAAMEFCTPKCRPGTDPPLIDGCTFCLGSGAGTKAAQIFFYPDPALTCPCGGSPAISLSGVSPGGSGPSQILEVSGPGVTPPYIIVGNAAGGSLPAGTNTVAGLVVANTCLDRDGNEVGWSCTYDLTFDFSPAGGSCASQPRGCISGVGAVTNAAFTLVSPCAVFCDAP